MNNMQPFIAMLFGFICGSFFTWCRYADKIDRMHRINTKNKKAFRRLCQSHLNISRRLRK